MKRLRITTVFWNKSREDLIDSLHIAHQTGLGISIIMIFFALGGWAPLLLLSVGVILAIVCGTALLSYRTFCKEDADAKKV